MGRPRTYKKPRIQLSVSQELYDVLTELGHVMGSARSSFPAEMLEQQLPVFQELLRVMRIARDNPALAREGLSEMLTATLVRTGQVKLQFDQESKKPLRKARS
jgi:hypothetical protein